MDQQIDSAKANIMDFKQFLESVPANVRKKVKVNWEARRGPISIDPVGKLPDLDLYCKRCDGIRAYRCRKTLDSSIGSHAYFFVYVCSNCQEQFKEYALELVIGEKGSDVSVYKFGERPSFGDPVPSKLLRIFGKDSKTFLKGRQCESQGLGIGAFSYYRRLVEQYRNELFERIINVCKILGGMDGLIEELEVAKSQNSFTASMDKLKSALPQGLLINGHNPLTILHKALSSGLHSEPDEYCLEIASNVRIVLAELVDRLSTMGDDHHELLKAVHLLTNVKKKD